MKTQNASALMRTADAFGVQRVDIYDKNERFNVSSGISKGVEKWLDTSFFVLITKAVWQSGSAAKIFRRKLYVTALNASAKRAAIRPTIPATICFGNEQEGTSEELRQHADQVIYIPMEFVESFNVASAGLSCTISPINGSWELPEV